MQSDLTILPKSIQPLLFDLHQVIQIINLYPRNQPQDEIQAKPVIYKGIRGCLPYFGLDNFLCNPSPDRETERCSIQSDKSGCVEDKKGRKLSALKQISA